MTFAIGANLPAGSIIQSPFDISDPNWLRCDGSVITRASYPVLSSLFPNVGTFTTTARTLAAAPSTPGSGGMMTIATNGTTVVASANGGSTAGAQYSTNNGVSWTLATTISGDAPSCVAWTGTNFVGVGASGIPTYSPTGVTWTASTGAATGAGGSNGANIASNGSGTVLEYNSAALYISTNNGTSYSLVTTAVAVTGPPVPIVWTGTQWLICAASSLQSSTTGATGTWTNSQIPPWGAQTPVSAVSDGAGNVLVVIGSSSVAYVSNNGGVTWRPTLLPGLAGGATYANGRWFVSLTSYAGTASVQLGDMAVSADLYSWIYVSVFAIPGAVSPSTYGGACVTYAGGNYIAIGAQSGTAAATVTENTANMYLPTTRRATVTVSAGGGSSQLSANANWQEWIKLT